MANEAPRTEDDKFDITRFVRSEEASKQQSCAVGIMASFVLELSESCRSRSHRPEGRCLSIGSFIPSTRHAPVSSADRMRNMFCHRFHIRNWNDRCEYTVIDQTTRLRFILQKGRLYPFSLEGSGFLARSIKVQGGLNPYEGLYSFILRCVGPTSFRQSGPPGDCLAPMARALQYPWDNTSNPWPACWRHPWSSHGIVNARSTCSDLTHLSM